MICRQHATMYWLHWKFGPSKCQHNFFGGRPQHTKKCRKKVVSLMPNIIYALNMKFAQIFSVKQNWKCLWLFQAEERSPKDVEAPNAKYHTFNCHMVIMFWQVLLLLIFYLKWNIILLHCGYSSVLLFKKTVLYLLVNPGFLLLRYWNELWSHCSCCNPKTKTVLYILSNTGFITASLQKWIPRMLRLN